MKISASLGRSALKSFPNCRVTGREINNGQVISARCCSTHTSSESSSLHSPQGFGLNGRCVEAQHMSRRARPYCLSIVQGILRPNLLESSQSCTRFWWRGSEGFCLFQIWILHLNACCACLVHFFPDGPIILISQHCAPKVELAACSLVTLSLRKTIRYSITVVLPVQSRSVQLVPHVRCTSCSSVG